jgi:hypothetical protein
VPAELKDLASELGTLTARLGGHPAEVAEVTATLSHELKTLMASVRGATELLRDSWETMSAEQHDRFLANVDADSERMQRLVTRLPVLARLGVLESPVEARPFRGELEALAERYPSVTVDLSELPKQMTISAQHLRMGVGISWTKRATAGRPRSRWSVTRGRAGCASGCETLGGSRQSTCSSSSNCSSRRVEVKEGRGWDGARDVGGDSMVKNANARRCQDLRYALFGVAYGLAI